MPDQSDDYSTRYLLGYPNFISRFDEVISY